MQSILDDIYYGRRGQVSNLKVTERYSQLQTEAIEKEQEILKNLTSEQIASFGDMCIYDIEQEGELARASYCEGFKVGFLIAVECFTK